MHISVYEKSPYFVKDHAHYEVHIDGEKVYRCVEADEENGTAWVLDLGLPGDAMRVKKVHGDVKIVRMPPRFFSLAGQEREAQRMLKEMMPCPECEKEMRANGYRCSHCGYEL
jgi:hypothetical protein